MLIEPAGRYLYVPSLLIVAGLALVSEPAHAASERVTVAVLNFDDRGAGPDMTSTLAAVVSNELSHMSFLQVITTRDIANMITVDQQRQLLGCNDASCMSELGDKLHTQYLVAGHVAKVGGTVVVELQLIDQARGKVDARQEVRGAGTTEALLDDVQHSVRKLIQPLLKSREGSVLLTVNVEGANVVLDDKLVGVTPVKRIVLNWGPHTIRIERNGFVAFAKDFDVDGDAVVAMDVVLVPSAEFIKSYETRNRWLRGAAWTGVVLAAVGAAGVVAWQVDGHNAQTEFGQKLSALQSSGAIIVTGDTYQYKNSQLHDADEPAMQALRTRGDNDTKLWEASAGVAGAGAVAAIVCFLVSEDPGRYDRFKVQRAELVPVFTGNGVALAWNF